MKKISAILILLLVLGVLAGCSNDMLKNSETGNYGPAWDVTMKLPAVDSQNNFGDLVDVKSFSDFGFVVRDTGDDNNEDKLSFTVVGTDQKPIGRTVDFNLPPLEVTRDEAFFEEKTDEFPVLGEETLPEIEIPFPLEGFVFGESSDSTYNKLNINVENTGDNTLENLNITVKTGNGDELKRLNYSGINSGNNSEQSIDFNGREVDYDNLKLEVSFEEQVNETKAKINFSGFTNLKIIKANNIGGEVLSDFSFNETIELGNALKINAYDYNDDDNDENAEFKFNISVPGAEGLAFDFSNTELDGVSVNSPDQDEDAYYIKDNTEISFGELELVSSINPENENETFSYDATKKMEASIDMVGQVQFDNPNEDEELPFDYEGNNLVYKTEGMEVEITQEQVDKINKYILSEDTYLNTEVISSLPVGLKGDVYLASSNSSSINKEELYIEDNKVNENSVIKVNGTDGEEVNTENKFVLGDIKNDDGSTEEGMITKIENAVENGENIFIGFKLNIGDIENSDDFDDENEKEYNFSDDQSIDTKAHIGVKVKVNQ